MCKRKITIIIKKCVVTEKTEITTKCPDYLYKFISLDSGSCKYEAKELNNKKFDTLKNNKIWLSHYSKMNDPFEYCGICSSDIDVNSEAGIMHKGFEDMKGQLFLSSLTEDLYNASMWAYYANNYNGFCIKYEVESNINNPKKIIYSDSPQEFSESQYDSILKKDENSVSNILSLKNRFIIKNNYWKQEREYRIFDSEQNAEKRNNNTSGFLKDLSEFGLSTKAIYLGINCNDENRKELISAARELDIKAFEMRRCSEKITFDFVEIKNEQTD